MRCLRDPRCFGGDGGGGGGGETDIYGNPQPYSDWNLGPSTADTPGAAAWDGGFSNPQTGGTLDVLSGFTGEGNWSYGNEMPMDLGPSTADDNPASKAWDGGFSDPNAQISTGGGNLEVLTSFTGTPTYSPATPAYDGTASWWEQVIASRTPTVGPPGFSSGGSDSTGNSNVGGLPESPPPPPPPPPDPVKDPEVLTKPGATTKPAIDPLYDPELYLRNRLRYRPGGIRELVGESSLAGFTLLS